MRTLKFRAWDKREKKMWTPIIDIDGTPCAKHPLTKHLIKMDGELLDPVMQFTGLLDRNGKEIFESDVVKIYGSVVSKVVWQFGSWQIYGGGLVYNVAEDEDIEIIGNLYETPELLNSSEEISQ